MPIQIEGDTSGDADQYVASQPKPPKKPPYGQHTGQTPAAPTPPAPAPPVTTTPYALGLTGGPDYTPPNTATGIYDEDQYSQANAVWQQLNWQAPELVEPDDWSFVYKRPTQALGILDRLDRVEKWTGKTLPADMSLALAESWLDDQELQRAATILSRRLNVPMSAVLPTVERPGGGADIFLDPRTGRPMSFAQARRLYKPYEQSFFEHLLPTIDADPLKMARTMRAFGTVGQDMDMYEALGAAAYVSKTLTVPQLSVFGNNMTLLAAQEGLTDQDKIQTAHITAIRDFEFSSDINSPNHYINWRLAMDIEAARGNLQAIVESEDYTAEDRRAAEHQLAMAEESLKQWQAGTAQATEFLTGTQTRMTGGGPVTTTLSEAQKAEGLTDEQGKVALELMSVSPGAYSNRWSLIVEEVKADVENADADFRNSILGEVFGLGDAVLDGMTQFINAGVYSVTNLPMIAYDSVFNRERLDWRVNAVSQNTKDLLFGKYSLAERAMKDAPWLPPAAAFSLELISQVAFDPLNIIGKASHVKKLFDLPLLDDAVRDMGALKHFWNKPILGLGYIGKSFKLTFGERIRAAMSHSYLWLGRKTVPEFLRDAATKYDNYEDFWAFAVGKLRNVVGTDALSHEVASGIFEYAQAVKKGEFVRDLAQQADDVGQFIYAGLMPGVSRADLPEPIRDLLAAVNRTPEPVALRPNTPVYEPFDYFGPPTGTLDDAPNWVQAYQAYMIDGFGKMRAIPRPGGLFTEFKLGARHIQWGGSRYRRSTLSSLMPNIEHGFGDWLRNYLYRGKDLFSRQEIGDYVQEAMRIVSPGTANREHEWIKLLGRVQDDIIRRVGSRYGLEADEVEEVIKSMRAELGELNKKLFGYAPEWMDDSDAIFKTPLVESQLPNKWVMTDPVKVQHMVSDAIGYRRGIRAMLQRALGKEVSASAFKEATAKMVARNVIGWTRDTYLRYWKAMTVATLRYVLRVPMFDEQLRVMADIGGLGWLQMRKSVSRLMDAAGARRPELWNDITDLDFVDVIHSDIVEAGFEDMDEVFQAIRLKKLGEASDEMVQNLDRLNPSYRKYFEDTLAKMDEMGDTIPTNLEWEEKFADGATPAYYDGRTGTIYVDGDWLKATQNDADFQAFKKRVYALDAKGPADARAAARFTPRRMLVVKPGKSLGDVENITDAKRIVVTGSRQWGDSASITTDMGKLADDAVLVEGGAKGADRLARIAAKRRGLSVETFEADWTKYGLSAGYRRNGEMLDSGADLVVAYWDPASKGGSQGTLNTIAAAWDRGIPVVVRVPDGVEQADLIEAVKGAMTKYKRFNRPASAGKTTTTTVKPAAPAAKLRAAEYRTQLTTMNGKLRHLDPEVAAAGLADGVAYAIDDVIPGYLQGLGFDVERSQTIAAGLKSQMYRALAEAREAGVKRFNLDEYWFEALDRRGFRQYSRTSRADSIEGMGKTPQEHFGVTEFDDEGNVVERVEGNRGELRRYYQEQRRAQNVVDESEAVTGYPTDLNTTIHDFLNDVKVQLQKRMETLTKGKGIVPPSSAARVAAAKSITNLSPEANAAFIALLKKNLKNHPEAELILKRAMEHPDRLVNDLLSGVLGTDAERAIIAATRGKEGAITGQYLPPPYDPTPAPDVYGSPSLGDPLRGDIHTQLDLTDFERFNEGEGLAAGDHRGYWFFDALIERYKQAHPRAKIGPNTRLLEGLGIAVPKPDLRSITINHELGHKLLEHLPEHVRQELLDLFNEKRVLDFDQWPQAPFTDWSENVSSDLIAKAYKDEFHELFADAYAAWKHDPEYIKDFSPEMFEWFERNADEISRLESSMDPDVRVLFREQTPEQLGQRISMPHYGELEDEVAVNSGRARDAFASREQEMKTMLKRMAHKYDINERKWGEVKPGDPHFFSTLTDVLHNQHGRSELSRRILTGLASNRSDDEIMETVYKWLREDEIGRNVAQRLLLRNRGDIEERIEILTKMLRDQTFNDAGIAQMALTNNPHLEGALRRASDLNPDVAQPVNGWVAAEVAGRPNPFATMWDGFTRFIFELPTNKLSRQPYFKYWYTNIKEGLLEAANDANKTITPDMLRSIDTQARAFAIERVEKVLFDFRKQSRFGEMMGFIMPFFQPWKEAFQVWGHLLRKNPAFAERARVVYNEMQDFLLEEDPITGEKRLALSNMWFAAPMLNMVFGGGGIGGIKGFNGSFSLSAPLASFNFLFGSMFELPTGKIAGNLPVPVPSLNPFIMFGMQKLADSDILPDFLKLSATRWAYQYGSVQGFENFAGGLLPTYMQHAVRAVMPELVGGEDILNSQAVDFLRMYEAQGLTPQSIMDMKADEQRSMFGMKFENVREAQSYLADRAMSDAKKMQGFRALFSFIMPAAPTVYFPTADLEREYRDLVEQWGWDVGRDMFIERHPDNALIAIPTTYWNRGKDAGGATTDGSVVPLPANALADALLKQPDFADFAKENPMWAFALLPSEAWTGEFDRALFFQQLDTGVRATRTPMEMYEALDREEGWDVWRDINTAYLGDQEILRMQQIPQSDPLWRQLDLDKEKALDKLAEQYPGWAVDYGTYSKYNMDPWVELHTRAALHSDIFRGTETGKGLLAYQELRQDVIKGMRELGITSLDTTSAEKYGLVKLYDQGLNRIFKNHPDFERAYNYFFSDDLNGVKTYGDRLIDGMSEGQLRTYRDQMEPWYDAREATRVSSDSGEVSRGYETMRNLSTHWMATYGWDKDNPQYIWWQTQSQYEKDAYRDSVAGRPYQYLSWFDREVILGEATHSDTEARIVTVADLDTAIQTYRHDYPFAPSGDLYERRDALVRAYMKEDPHFSEWVHRVNTWGWGFFAATGYDKLPGREGSAWASLRAAVSETQRIVEANEWHGESDFNPVNRDMYAAQRLKLENLVNSLKEYSNGFATEWERLEERVPGPYLLDDFMPTSWFRYGG